MAVTLDVYDGEARVTPAERAAGDCGRRQLPATVAGSGRRLLPAMVQRYGTIA